MDPEFLLAFTRQLQKPRTPAIPQNQGVNTPRSPHQRTTNSRQIQGVYILFAPYFRRDKASDSFERSLGNRKKTHAQKGVLGRRFIGIDNEVHHSHLGC